MLSDINSILIFPTASTAPWGLQIERDDAKLTTGSVFDTADKVATPAPANATTIAATAAKVAVETAAAPAETAAVAAMAEVAEATPLPAFPAALTAMVCMAFVCAALVTPLGFPATTLEASVAEVPTP